MKKELFNESRGRGYTPPVTTQVIIYQTEPCCLSGDKVAGEPDTYYEDFLDELEWENE